MEKAKFTDSKRMTVVRCRESLVQDPIKKASYPYQVKVRMETTDRDGDVSVEHRYLNSKVKVEKPGEYEFYVSQGSMVNREKPGELITWLKIEDIRK